MKLALRSFFFFLALLASHFFAPKILAQQLDNSCQDIVATPDIINASGSITVQARLNTSVNIAGYQLRLIYGRAGVGAWMEGSIPLDSSAVSGSSGNWTVTGTLNSDLLADQGTYNLAFQANGVTFSRNNADCLDTVFVDTNTATAGSCDDELVNRAECIWNSSGTSWIVEQNFCDNGLTPPASCTSNNLMEFGQQAADRRRACVPCQTQTTATKNHGDTCSSTNECIDAVARSISCRSVSSPNRCLYNPNSRTLVGDSCVVGENECDSRLICGGGATGTLGTCQTRPECTIPQSAPPATPWPDSECGNLLNNPYAYCTFDFVCQDYRPDTLPDRTGEVQAFDLCKQTADYSSNGPDYQSCVRCITGTSTPNDPIDDIDDANTGRSLWTAFGCVHVDKQGMIKDFLRIGLALSGGFVLISILYGAFILATSSGEPKRVQEGQEMISSAIMGLLFVIFSIIILQFIGVQILRIPGFGT